MVHSEVHAYLNKYVVSIAPFPTPAFTPIQKTALFACFRFLIFHPFFQGVSWPHLPLYADAHVSDVALLATNALYYSKYVDKWKVVRVVKSTDFKIGLQSETGFKKTRL